MEEIKQSVRYGSESIWQFGSDQKVLDWKFYYEDILEYGISVFLDRNEAEATIKKG